uniref:Uncharacterized protein n=1 Tax=Amphimedon queenslandica TaxID=400682 RepID=A0A1X7SGJ5_AMPQE
MEGSMSPEYITMKEMLADLVDLLAGNALVISQLNNHLFSSDLIPKAVHVTVGTTGLTPYDRANKIFSSVLATIEYHSNPNSVFSSLIMSLQNVELNDMVSKLIKKLRNKGGIIKDDQIEALTVPPPIPTEPHGPSQTSEKCENVYEVPHKPYLIELSSQEEVARNIESLHEQFTGLATKIRTHFDELVSSGKLKASVVAFHAEEYWGKI